MSLQLPPAPFFAPLIVSLSLHRKNFELNYRLGRCDQGGMGLIICFSGRGPPPSFWMGQEKSFLSKRRPRKVVAELRMRIVLLRNDFRCDPRGISIFNVFVFPPLFAILKCGRAPYILISVRVSGTCSNILEKAILTDKNDPGLIQRAKSNSEEITSRSLHYTMADHHALENVYARVFKQS